MGEIGDTATYEKISDEPDAKPLGLRVSHFQIKL